MIQCKCGDAKCKQVLHIQNENNHCVITNERELLLYLDANELLKLIQTAKEVYMSLANDYPKNNS